MTRAAEHKRRLADLRQRVRPNRLAAGVSATLDRQRAYGTWRGRYSSDATLSLAVYGTCDPLARKAFPAIAKGKCPCCNGSGRVGYVMTDKGKARLARLRKGKGA